MTVFKYHLLTFAFIFVLNSSLAFASSGSNQKIDMGALGPSTPQTAKKVERVYEQMTYAALTKLAWSYGAYRAGNSEDLNAYIIITECNLYNKFFS